MLVEETLSFDECWSDPQFSREKPNPSGSVRQRYGDIIYHQHDDRIHWVQENGRHSLEDGSANRQHVRRDTSFSSVLIASEFVYYGANDVRLPAQFRDWFGHDVCAGSRGYRYKHPEGLSEALAAWIEPKLAMGHQGRRWTGESGLGPW